MKIANWQNLLANDVITGELPTNRVSRLKREFIMAEVSLLNYHCAMKTVINFNGPKLSTLQSFKKKKNLPVRIIESLHECHVLSGWNLHPARCSMGPVSEWVGWPEQVRLAIPVPLSFDQSMDSSKVSIHVADSHNQWYWSLSGGPDH